MRPTGPRQRQCVALVADPAGHAARLHQQPDVLEAGDDQALSREYVYYDPIYTLSEIGQNWWRRNTDMEALQAAAFEEAGASRHASVRIHA